MKIRAKILALMAGLLSLVLVGGAEAQTQFGTVSGRISDQNEGLVQGAKVTLTETATNVERVAETNSRGLYTIANVPAGPYRLVIEKQGFSRITVEITVEVAQRLGLDFSLKVGPVEEDIKVSGGEGQVNTASGDLSRVVTERELIQLPLVTRNPYALAVLTPGALDIGVVHGDRRGVGLALNGQRTASINFMLDGGENNEAFRALVGQSIPLDAVQEFRVQSNNMTAEFGRSAVVTNVITKSGGNNYHGSVYEFYRGAGLSSTPFEDNANHRSKSNFVRNQFGASAGGPILKDRTFFFGSFEGLRVRSSATRAFFVPTSDFFNAASLNTRNFLNAFGGLPTATDPRTVVTVADILRTERGTSLVNANTGAALPLGTPLFARTLLRAPVNSGGGDPQNTWLFTSRIDHRFNERTGLAGRYAFENSNLFDGSNSLSPFQGFNTGQTSRNQNLNLTLTHTFTPMLFSETRGVFNRLFNLQPLGEAPSTTPCWQYLNLSATPTGDLITFPGYLPSLCRGSVIPGGGPQNVYQFYQGFTYARGSHTFKLGGQYLHLRDNRTIGAFQNAYFRTDSMQGMLNGDVNLAQLAIDPNGKVPGQTYSLAADGPFRFPSFTRHFHYNELAFYGEDSVKVRPRLTLTLGLRYEYFGVLHSPRDEQLLDANLYFDAVGAPNPNKTLFEQVRDAQFRRTNQFYKPDYNNFAPRVGFAWDLFGKGRTVFRGGYGIFYDRNYGNALFNAIQNPPNYAVVTLNVPTGLPIRPNQFETLATAGGGTTLPLTSTARMLDNNLRTAYSAQWNGTLEHDLNGRGVVASISYVGSNGYQLYSLNNLNQLGSCLLLQRLDPSFPCNPGALTSASRLNQTGLTSMNRRGNEGFSRYHGLSLALRSQRLGSTGLLVSGNYTWSHTIDNSSSFMADSFFEGRFFGFGFRDPYNPALDRADSTNDIRHRVTISNTWEIPFARGYRGLTGQLLDGWSMSGIFQAQTGGAFTVYDRASTVCNASAANFCYPVIVGSIPNRTETESGLNRFTLYSGLQNTFRSVDAVCGGDLACAARIANLQPQLLSPRNLFRTPGYWNFDLGLAKQIKLPAEGMTLQFRSEFFNLFNHANLFALPGTNQFTGASSVVQGARGRFPNEDLERRNIQLALRLTF
ncbi:MAG TPA: TonB-dependent receptor [Blastocatellia bacterium]|nr:TonB-dependent receptor [Blastocatellia bacterium]